MIAKNRITTAYDPEIRICEECEEQMEFDGFQWECIYCGHKEDDEPEYEPE